MRALRHGMAGQPGWELFGPWDDGEAVREAIVEAGEEFGLRQVGGRAYSSNTLESGWIPSPLPAVYSGESAEAVPRVAAGERLRRRRPRSAAASPRSDIEDYYFTPWDLGYGNYVKFDHDFIGREALERMAEGEHRQKVTLALDDEDVTRDDRQRCPASPSVRSSSTGRRPSTPCTRSTASPSTARRSASRPGSATAPTRARCSRSPSLDAEHAEPGTEVTFVWGEEDGGTAKPTVEPHEQIEIARDRQPGSVRRGGAEVVCAEQLARGARMTRRASAERT